MGGVWSRECRHLDTHPDQRGDPPADGAVGLPAGPAAGLPGRQGRVAAVLCGPGAGIGADRLKQDYAIRTSGAFSRFESYREYLSPSSRGARCRARLEGRPQVRSPQRQSFETRAKWRAPLDEVCRDSIRSIGFMESAPSIRASPCVQMIAVAREAPSLWIPRIMYRPNFEATSRS